MIGEDHRSQAYMNFNRLISTKIDLKSKDDELIMTKEIIGEKDSIIETKEQTHQEDLMLNEDHVCQIVYKTQTIESLRAIISGHEETIEELTTIKDNQKKEIEDFTN